MRTKFAFIFLLSLKCSLGWGFHVSPMLLEFAPSGPQATQTIIVENNSDKSTAVQVEAYHRLHDAQGKEKRTPSDEFVIYPQQFILEKKEKRTIRITWIGEKQPSTELPYRIIVGELPISFQDSTSKNTAAGSLKFLMEYVTSSYIKPMNAKPKVEPASVSIKDNVITLALKNSGSAHQLLRGIHLTFKEKDGNKWELAASELKQFETENLLPNAVRIFSFPNRKKLMAPLTTEISFDSF